jgi:hypothetical protein
MSQLLGHFNDSRNPGHVRMSSSQMSKGVDEGGAQMGEASAYDVCGETVAEVQGVVCGGVCTLQCEFEDTRFGLFHSNPSAVDDGIEHEAEAIQEFFKCSLGIADHGDLYTART